eukprot:CAMPEP_0167741844 /NCGR_PEP_ID=MMETSP0110_2-20121227/1086_1 /TAXON_ID=629695 /ORGANISM="Gymnochlora sp., Strain CCMP2014" /LENGTH=240 /DNA_ID=CAMNT_0007625949 /DNA_START=149 /DNA_END=868 /DNA_ORIENTATION=-
MDEIFRIQQYAAKCTFFLPPFEVQQARRTVAKLQELASTEKAKLCPRKKFKFRKRLGRRPKGSEEEKNKQSLDESKNLMDKKESLDTMYTISDMEGKTLTIQQKDLTKQNLVLMQNLKSSKITVLTKTQTVRLVDLKDCTIFAGPVAGPIYVQNCSRCTLVLSCRQLRTHDTKDCRFFLYIASNPIIENCEGIGVASSSSLPEGIRKLLPKEFEVSESGKNLWDKVNDFNWLKQQKSPNW